jgi:CheY-like chemotaxis protein
MVDFKKLTAAGFSVVEAWSTDDALSYLESRGDIRVVICDADMPGGLNGSDLAAFICQRWPHIKIVIRRSLAGYQPTLPPAVVLMPSSSSPEDLLDRVQGMLARN